MKAHEANIIYVAPPYVWGIGVAIAIYLATVGNLMGYLKRTHSKAWAAMGSPSMNLEAGIGNWLPLMGSIFLGLRFELPEDDKLTVRLWIVRLLFLFVLTLIIVGKSFDLLPAEID